MSEWCDQGLCDVHVSRPNVKFRLGYCKFCLVQIVIKLSILETFAKNHAHYTSFSHFWHFLRVFAKNFALFLATKWRVKGLRDVFASRPNCERFCNTPNEYFQIMKFLQYTKRIFSYVVIFAPHENIRLGIAKISHLTCDLSWLCECVMSQRPLTRHFDAKKVQNLLRTRARSFKKARWRSCDIPDICQTS